MSKELEARQATLTLLKSLDSTALALEALADEAVQLASDFGNGFGGEALREIARSQRVRALELRGQFASLSTEYARRFHSKL